jgi:site-specific DNA recombinase
VGGEDIMVSVTTSGYDGCGRCLVGVRRLSRMSDSTSSPEKQRGLVLAAAEAVGAHVIAWADDFEVSGATDPKTRPGLGPWLRGEKGLYDGLAASAVDRLGRNTVDVLTTAYDNHAARRILITGDHPGVWDLEDPNQETELAIKALGAQMEHRGTRTRIRQEGIRARNVGKPMQAPSYGYLYVRLTPKGKIDHVEIDRPAHRTLLFVAERILLDTTGTISVGTEATRLNREGVLSPFDHRRVMYGRDPKGNLWTGEGLRSILVSQAALGYLMHDRKPVIGEDGKPIKIAKELWDYTYHLALVAKLETTPTGKRGPKSTYMCAGPTGPSWCGNCGRRLYIDGTGGMIAYQCKGRILGVPASQDCKPAPSVMIPKLDGLVTEFFLDRFGSGELLRQEFDPGTGNAARIDEIMAARNRLRSDREAGIYDSPEDAQWFRERFNQMNAEIEELRALPERPAAVRMVPTGETVADSWNAAHDDARRREMLLEFGVRVTLLDRSHTNRIRITGGDFGSAA